MHKDFNKTVKCLLIALYDSHKMINILKALSARNFIYIKIADKECTCLSLELMLIISFVYLK